MKEISHENANTKSIFDHLCDQMNKLDAKTITVEDAKAQANLAKQANNVLRYELDRAVAFAKFGENLNIKELDR